MATFVLMAGGTGGHLFPAMALAQEFGRRGHVVHLATDERVRSYGKDFPAKKVHIIPAATPSLSNPIKFVGASFTILKGIGVAWGALRDIDPDAVVAFGGYPCFPPFLAASLMGIPGVLHEQNAVLGRANRALARFANALALHFDKTLHAEKFSGLREVTGNPVRDRVIAASGRTYPDLSDEGPIELLVFGGSQGARALSDLVPPAIAPLPEILRRRVRVTQQCREEDLERVTAIYRDAHVNVQLATFFDDLPERMAGSHLVISRSGASTVAELGVIGRPAILIPLPGSLDQDQRANATLFEQGGGGWLADQANLSPQSLASRLVELLAEPKTLINAADHAAQMGFPDAVKRLADLVERVAEAGERK
ncbi:MAG: undecaprenyldiphospho-muramoylpentapeptide beta-N-acetylglucosaminyltransferase [Hyphomicrobiaceae bacterium]|nr:undecaprenyldiphospho-muramoylpentapeptide beta-N-acetylglucosaminyltransferase [Hyphomicrobiaceae bacterium]MCC0024883.1 undecaprenyldiphospho-muramoylpentapeptide beta-N-acetylglucosaminyltransferase [Hyphomicrobiaceae bacterium]